MRSRILALALLATAPVVAADADLLATYAQFRKAALDPSRVAVAENLTIQKSGGKLQFTSGTLYALEPVLDQVAGIVFIGDGVFTMDPPTAVERAHLGRFTGGQPRLEEPFKEAVFFFSDSSFKEFSAGANFKPGMVDTKATGVLNDFRKAFRDSLKVNIEARVLAGLTSDKQSVFLADIHGQKHGKLLFTVDAMSGETVSLTHYNLPHIYDLWSSYTPTGSAPAAQRALVQSSRIDLNTQLDRKGKIDAAAQDDFTALADGSRMLLVQLAPSLRVSKITGGEGVELKFIQEAKDKDGDLWVILPSALARGQKYSWKFAYAGDGVVRNAGAGNYFVGQRDRWYPKPDVPIDSFNDRALYHMKFENPKGLTLVATGKPVNQSNEGKIATSEWETEVPYTVVGFNYGDYKSKSTKNNDPEVTVFANSELPDDMKELKLLLEEHPDVATSLGINSGGINTTGMMDRELAEAANALRLFSAYFGPLPYKKISVTQQPSGNFGQSWPTLIFMPSTSFLDDVTRHQLGMDQGREKQFFTEVGAHEISHQWWGHLVSWNDYHDQWLSEGFAQFSAGLYQHRAAGEKKFRAFLEGDREYILSPLPESSERANDAGPIWMGQRLSTDNSLGASRLIYAKGGFVLHMLRMMMYDYGRNDDSKFIAMMKDFVQTNAGKAASTADFKAICDKHFGMDMQWFFDQWVYGTGIPKLSVEYGISDGADGPVLTVDIKQEKVPDGFRSVLPLLLRFKGGAAGGTLLVSKPTAHAEIKLKEKPDSVEFNPYYGLLCELDVKKR